MKYLALVMVLCMVGVGCKSVGMRVDSKPVNKGDVVTVNGGEIDGTGERIAIMYLHMDDGTVIPMGNWSAASWGKQALGVTGMVGSATMNGFAGSFNIESGLRDSGDNNNTNISQTNKGGNASQAQVLNSKTALHSSTKVSNSLNNKSTNINTNFN